MFFPQDRVLYRERFGTVKRHIAADTYEVAMDARNHTRVDNGRVEVTPDVAATLRCYGADLALCPTGQVVVRVDVGASRETFTGQAAATVRFVDARTNETLHESEMWEPASPIDGSLWDVAARHAALKGWRLVEEF